MRRAVRFLLPVFSTSVLLGPLAPVDPELFDELPRGGGSAMRVRVELNHGTR